MIEFDENRLHLRNRYVTFAQPIRDIFCSKRNRYVTFAQPIRDIL